MHIIHTYIFQTRLPRFLFCICKITKYITVLERSTAVYYARCLPTIHNTTDNERDEIRLYFTVQLQYICIWSRTTH